LSELSYDAQPAPARKVLDPGKKSAAHRQRELGQWYFEHSVVAGVLQGLAAEKRALNSDCGPMYNAGRHTRARVLKIA
jgi:hypothetical protein